MLCLQVFLFLTTSFFFQCVILPTPRFLQLINVVVQVVSPDIYCGWRATIFSKIKQQQKMTNITNSNFLVQKNTINIDSIYIQGTALLFYANL